MCRVRDSDDKQMDCSFQRDSVGGLLPIHPFPGRTASRPAQKEDTNHEGRKLFNVLSSQFAASGTFPSGDTVLPALPGDAVGCYLCFHEVLIK